MYVPAAFREQDLEVLRGLMRAAGLCQFVTATEAGPVATPLPMWLDAEEGEHGVLYGHVARANPQWQAAVIGDGLAIFSGADAYVSPSWYPSKQEHGKVVPTWNYEAVHAYGPVEFFDEAGRLLAVVQRLTEAHEGARGLGWAVGDAPEGFIAAQLRGIVGIRMPIRRLEGKRKLSQNRSSADRAGVVAGLSGTGRDGDRVMAGMIGTGEG